MRTSLFGFRDSLESESVVCETTQVWRAEPMSPVKVFFDGVQITLEQDFVYHKDPVIKSIQPLESIMQ